MANGGNAGSNLIKKARTPFGDRAKTSEEVEKTVSTALLHRRSFVSSAHEQTSKTSIHSTNHMKICQNKPRANIALQQHKAQCHKYGIFQEITFLYQMYKRVVYQE